MRDRWRRRRRLFPTPKHWWGRVLVGLLRLGVALLAAVGLTLVIALIGGWTGHEALAKVFIIVGAVFVALMGAGALTSGRRDTAGSYSTTVVTAEEGGNRMVAWSLAWFAVGWCLVGIGFLLDATK